MTPIPQRILFQGPAPGGPFTCPKREKFSHFCIVKDFHAFVNEIHKTPQNAPIDKQVCRTPSAQ